MEKKNVILLTVIAVATLLITVVGATFAYYSITATADESVKKIEITSVKGFSILYDDGAEITASNVIPGWGDTYHDKDTKTITVTNESDYDIEYELIWQAVENTFIADDQANLEYKLIGTSSKTTEGVAETVVNKVNNDDWAKAPTSDSNSTTIVKQTLKAGEKITYTYSMHYKNSSSPQGDPTTSKQFTAKISINDDTIKVLSTQPGD